MAHLLLRPIGRGARTLWRHLPPRVLATRPMRRVGSFIYERYTRRSQRWQSHSTHFKRNVPQLDVMVGEIGDRPEGAILRVASIGCSTGAELYSALAAIHAVRPDLRLIAHGLDISPEVAEIAGRGVYRPGEAAAEGALYLAGQPDLFEDEVAGLGDILEPVGDGSWRVRDALRAETSFFGFDASDPRLVERLPPQDIVIANNFLGPMDDRTAERCLRNVIALLRPGGILVLDGVDVDVKLRMLAPAGLSAVERRIEEIHLADPTKQDWPWTRWSHEPPNPARRDYAMRYATVFRKPEMDEG